MARSKMKKGVFVVILIAVALPAFIVFILLNGEEYIEAKIIQGIESGTGLSAEVEFIDFDMEGRVAIRGLRLYNRSNYPDRLFYDIPEVNARFSTWSFVFGERSLKKLFIHIRELHIIKNKEGKVNLTEKESSGLDSPIQLLILRLDKIYFKDYSVDFGPVVQTFEVDIEERYHDVTSFKDLGGLIGFEALRNSALSRLLGLSPQEFLQQNVVAPLAYANEFVSGSVDRAAETAGSVVGGTIETAGSVVEGTAETVEDLAGGAASAAGELIQGAAGILTDPFSQEKEPSGEQHTEHTAQNANSS